MLPLVIIEEIRKREERDRALRERPAEVQIPLPTPPRTPPRPDENNDSSSVIVIDVG